mmetsp:Transcript_96878/g.224572  ORF Transcript_96878/g.224572 Transcript_96878/m.224572 type:complete len:218 (-) Transcript_96878:170-823(-)
MAGCCRMRRPGTRASCSCLTAGKTQWHFPNAMRFASTLTSGSASPSQTLRGCTMPAWSKPGRQFARCTALLRVGSSSGSTTCQYRKPARRARWQQSLLSQFLLVSPSSLSSALHRRSISTRRGSATLRRTQHADGAALSSGRSWVSTAHRTCTFSRRTAGSAISPRSVRGLSGSSRQSRSWRATSPWKMTRTPWSTSSWGSTHSPSSAATGLLPSKA